MRDNIISYKDFIKNLIRYGEERAIRRDNA